MAVITKIKLTGENHQDVDLVCSQIKAICDETGVKLRGPIPLPTRIDKFTVNRSPHIDKKAREQFEIRTHKRLIYISDSTTQTVDALMKLDLAAGVDVQISV